MVDLHLNASRIHQLTKYCLYFGAILHCRDLLDEALMIHFNIVKLELIQAMRYLHTKSVPSLIRVKSNQISEHFLILVSLNKCMRREQPIQRRVLEGGNNTCVDSSVKSEACLNPTQGALKMEKVHLCPKDSIMRWCIKGKSVNWTGMWHAGLTNISWLNVIP